MPTPLEICLEDLELSEADERYVRCVALPGGEPGLALDRDGAVRWMPTEPAAYGLWVSADERLVLIRGDGAAPIAVTRGGRSLEAPEGKPVVLLDQDLLLVNGRRLVVHVHGIAHQIHPPERLSPSSLARMARTAAAALALSAAVALPAQGAFADVATPIEVRAQPPAPPPMRAIACTVTAMTPATKGGPLLVHATCQSAQGLYVGSRGTLFDAAGKPIPDGSVTIKQLQGTKIVGETQLRTPVKAKTVNFYVH